MAHPTTIMKLVEHRQEMEKFSWCLRLIGMPLAGALLIGALMLLNTSSKREIDQLIPTAGGGLTEETNNKTGGSEKKNITPQGFVKTSGGVMSLQPFGNFKIVKDTFLGSIPNKAALTDNEIDPHADLSQGEGGSLLLGRGEGTSDIGFGYADDDFGLPPREVKFKLNIQPIGNWKMSTYDEDRLPRGTYPRVILQESSTSPSFRFIPDSAFVFGWLHFQTNGMFRFIPLPDKHPIVTDRLQEYLTAAVVQAYNRTPCIPAIVNGELEEQRFPCIIYFHHGDNDVVWSANPSTKVIMTKM